MSGRIKFREDIVEGLDNAPDAFIGLLHGKNFGKLMVRVSPDPTRGSALRSDLKVRPSRIRTLSVPRSGGAL